MDVGLELRQARERRGLSLLELSKITKIGLRRLQAIEDSDEHNLPATVFTRSFVKSYAAEVGLDPDQTWRRFAEQFEPADASQNDTAVPEPAPAPRRLADGAASLANELWPRARVLYGRFGTGAVLILVSATVLAIAGRGAQQPQSGAGADAPSRAASPAVSAAGFVPARAPQPVPIGTSGTTAPANALRLEIAPTGPCWMQATVGEQRVLASLLAAGDRRTIDSPSEVTLRIGDPAVCAFSINGTPAHVPGAPGKAMTLHVTKENYRQFLAK